MQLWYENANICHSQSRQIDSVTLVDLLQLLEYQYQRTLALEAIGLEDKGDPTDVLLDYVLDALGAPPNDYLCRHGEFSRNELYDIFYDDYLKLKKYANCKEVLEQLIIVAKKSAIETQFNRFDSTDRLAS